MTTINVTVTSLGPVQHDRKDYAEGESFDIEAKLAAQLIASGSVVPTEAGQAEGKTSSAKPASRGQAA